MQHFLLANLNFVSDAGDKTSIVAGLGVVVFFYLLLLGYKRESFLLLLSSFGLGLAFLLKMFFKELRPITAQPFFKFDIYSFPSAHTLTYTAFFGLVLYFCLTLSKVNRNLRTVAGLMSIYFIALIGVSRVYLGQHYVVDVIGGYIFGFMYLGILIWLEKHTKS